MISPIPTPYDDKLARLRERLDKRKGSGGGAGQDLRRKIQNTKARAYNYGQANYQAPIPYSGQYDATVANLNQSYNNAQLGIAGQRLGVEQQYGFGSDRSNPFSQARMLERDYQQRVAGTQNSMAAAGQLYSGALSNAKAQDRFNYEQGLDTAQREYQAKLAELTQRGLQATTDYTSGLIDAEGDRLEYALNEPVDPMEAAPPPGYVQAFNKRQRDKDKGKNDKGKKGKK